MMTPRTTLLLALAAVCSLTGCPKNAEIANGGGAGAGSTAGAGGIAGAGSAGVGNAGKGGGHAGTGSAGSGTAGGSGGGAAGTGTAGKGAAGSGGGTSCPPNIAIPALCRMCSDGTCGTPTCNGSMFTGFVCPKDQPDAGTAGTGGGGVCNLACVKGKHCELVAVTCIRAPCPPVAMCVDDTPDAGTGGMGPSCGGIAGLACPGSGNCVDVPGDGCDPMAGGADCPGMCECRGGVLCPIGKTFNPSPDVCSCEPTSTTDLHWVQSCGTPVCTADPGNFDDPSIPNCTTQKEGQPCTTAGDRCDGVFGCGATLLCATAPPKTCPVSRARYKQDIRYLEDREREQFHDQVTQLKLASYRYKSAPEVPQLGFMIDDVEPSVAVAGDHVNLYGYLSMAVAAIQVQDQQLKSLEQQVEQLRARLGDDPAQAVCGP